MRGAAWLGVGGAIAVALGVGCGGESSTTGSGGAPVDPSSSSGVNPTMSSSSGTGGEGGTIFTTSSSSSSSSSTGGGGASASSSSSSSSSGAGGCMAPGDCPAGECEDPTCSANACSVTPKAKGEKCGAKLCDGAGLCVDHIPVKCQTADGLYVACDGQAHNYSVDYLIGNTFYPCASPSDVGYCPPGNVCQVFLSMGPAKQGTCQ